MIYCIVALIILTSVLDITLDSMAYRDVATKDAYGNMCVFVCACMCFI